MEPEMRLLASEPTQREDEQHGLFVNREQSMLN